MVYRMNEKKKPMRWEDIQYKLLALRCSLYLVFPRMLCLERRRGRRLCLGCGGIQMSWMSFGPKYSFFHQEVSQRPPSGLTVCLQAVELAAAAPSHLHRSVSKETTRRESLLSSRLVFVYFNLFCILQKKKKKPNFKQMLFSLLGYVFHHLPLMLSDSMHCCAVCTL